MMSEHRPSSLKIESYTLFTGNEKQKVKSKREKEREQHM